MNKTPLFSVSLATAPLIDPPPLKAPVSESALSAALRGVARSAACVGAVVVWGLLVALAGI